MFWKKGKKRGEDTRKGRAAVPATPTPPGAEAGGTSPGALDAGSASSSLAAASTQFLTGDSSTDKRTVQVLLEAIAQVSESRDIDQLLEHIVDRSVEVTGAERGLLILRDGGEFSVRVARGRVPNGGGAQSLEGDTRFSTTIAGKVLDELQAVRATVQSESEALDLGRSVYDLKLRAVMCVPLSTATDEVGARAEGGAPAEGQKAEGVLYVDSRAATRQFSQRDLGLFAALAHHISIAMENARLHLDSIEKLRLEQSLELASVIQRDLMPDIPDDLEGYDVHGWYRPAEQTAGDFYDVVPTKDGRLAVSVGDVTGHGIGPALITASAQASMRSYLRLLQGPGEVVTMLNQDLCERIDDGRFVTLFLGLFSKDGRLEQINAGHAEVLHFQGASGEVRTYEKDGPALGMLEDEQFSAREPVELAPGDVVAVYSDGLTEARPVTDADALFGEQRLKDELAALAAQGLDAGRITETLAESVLQHAGGAREDDMTLLVVRRV